MTIPPVLDSLYCCTITLRNKSTGFGHVAQASQQLLNKTNKTRILRALHYHWHIVPSLRAITQHGRHATTKVHLGKKTLKMER